jgi:acyltransferase
MRISWIDNAKAMALLLIMLGHTKFSVEYPNFDDYTSSFKIPLFFFISGYLVNNGHIKKGFNHFFKIQIQRLLKPYLSFWIISYLYWLPMSLTKSSQGLQAQSTLYTPIFGFFYGINETLQPNVVLWFFPCIFITSIFFFSLYKYINRNTGSIFLLITIIGLITAYLGNNPKIRLPWNIEIALVALVFFSLGYICKNKNIIEKILFDSSLYNLGIAGSLLILLSLIVKFNGHVRMSGMIFGNPLLFFVASIVGIFAAIYLCHILPKNIALEWISKNSIIIFPLHPILFSLFTGIGITLFHRPYDFKEHLIYYFGYVFTALIICIPISLLIRKYTPVLIGLKK